MIGVIASVAAPLVMGAIQNVISQKTARDMEGDLQNAQGRIDDIIGGRQEVLDSSGKIRDMKSMVSNPYANLAVATQAAEQQMAQTDQALANTLDTIRSTGGGAGGATALAQAAAQSKASVSADIQKQEATNAKLAAQGEAQLQKDKVNIENKALAEEVSAYGRQEDRDIVQLNRMQSEIEGRDAEARAYEQQSAEAIMAGVGGAGSALSGVSFN